MTQTTETEGIGIPWAGIISILVVASVVGGVLILASAETVAVTEDVEGSAIESVRYESGGFGSSYFVVGLAQETDSGEVFLLSSEGLIEDRASPESIATAVRLNPATLSDSDGWQIVVTNEEGQRIAEASVSLQNEFWWES